MVVGLSTQSEILIISPKSRTECKRSGFTPEVIFFATSLLQFFKIKFGKFGGIINISN